MHQKQAKIDQPEPITPRKKMFYLMHFPHKSKGYSSKLSFPVLLIDLFQDAVPASFPATQVLWIDSTDPSRFQSEIKAQCKSQAVKNESNS
jgi:hypothetical protein